MYRICCLLVILFWGVSCHEDAVNNPLLDSIPPNIRIISPDSTSILSRSGETLSLTLLVIDNVGLDSLKVYREVLAAEGDILEEKNIVDRIALGGKEQQLVYEIVLPFFPSFSQVFYDFEVTDQKQASERISQKITILSGGLELSDVNYRVNTYRNKRVYAPETDSISGFNFTTQRTFTSPFSSALDVDISICEQETARFPSFFSPNNDYLQVDSIFVISDTSKINFIEADYQIISNAFNTSGQFYDKTPSLNIGDIAIVRLIKAPQQQFVLMLITSMTDDVQRGIQYVEFDYKVSSE